MDSKTNLTKRRVAEVQIPASDEDEIEQVEIDEDNEQIRRRWRAVVSIFTCCIPDFCLKCFISKDPDARQAWREKLVLFVSFMVIGVGMVFVFGFSPVILCPPAGIYTWDDIHQQQLEDWIVVHGTIYDVKDYVRFHPGGTEKITALLGQDGSYYFKRKNPLDINSLCLTTLSNMTIPEPKCPSQLVDTEKDFVFQEDLWCHRGKPIGAPIKGELAFAWTDVNDFEIDWVVIHNRIYDVTSYLANETYYLEESLDKLIKNKEGEDDTTILFDRLYEKSETLLECLDDLFFVGVIDDRFSLVCHVLDITVLVSISIVGLIVLIKFIGALAAMGKERYKERNKYVIVNIPCYTEKKAELEKTINSIVKMNYPDDRKLLFIVADGIVTGRKQKSSTVKQLLSIFGITQNVEKDSFEYASLGPSQLNRAKVYSGKYSHEGHIVPVVIVVKVGMPDEEVKPGNRGKRDSQLILLRFLNKVLTGKPLNELEQKIYSAFDQFAVAPSMYEYMMTVDSDTKVEPDALGHMVYRMSKSSKVVALCGETRVANKFDSWITAIQVFEYYINHHMNKAFESLFGTVTCLPGCFSCYRIRFKKKPCLVTDAIIHEYSDNNVDTLHKKNLLHLGEDRFLTTLLLKYFPDGILSFITEAVCKTNVPNRFCVLMSQRRRWVNSTIHNLFELLRLDTLRGVCCFGMKFIVFMDLISTMMLPTGIVYLGYLIYLFVTQKAAISIIIVAVLAVIFGLQALVFLLKRKIGYIFWMVLYLVALPVFYIIIPIYSFWNMDQFGWGGTQKLARTKKHKRRHTINGPKTPNRPSRPPPPRKGRRQTYGGVRRGASLENRGPPPPLPPPVPDTDSSPPDLMTELNQVIGVGMLRRRSTIGNKDGMAPRT